MRQCCAINLSQNPYCSHQVILGDEDEEALGGSGCGFAQPTLVKEGAQVFITFPEDDETVGEGQDRRRLFTGADAYKILFKIPPKHKQMMGFTPGKSDPLWLVLTSFPVPPLTVRPTVSFG